MFKPNLIAMEEYIIETKLEKEWQKHLNQWKHEFHLEIVSAIPIRSGELRSICIVLKRTKREA